jgi:hypothetical protein
MDAATQSGARHGAVLAEYGRTRRRLVIEAGVVLAVVLVAAAYVKLLDFATLARGVPAILAIMRESFRRISLTHCHGGSRSSTRWR